VNLGGKLWNLNKGTVKNVKLALNNLKRIPSMDARSTFFFCETATLLKIKQCLYKSDDPLWKTRKKHLTLPRPNSKLRQIILDSTNMRKLNSI
jgi:hypothetical protein